MHVGIRILFAFVIMVAAPESFAQAPDSLGWGGTRWGMSAEEILSVVPEARMLDEPLKYSGSTVFVEVPALKIGDLPYNVHFLMDDTDQRLIQVNLRSIGDSDYVVQWAFNNLKSMLIEKYGPPALHETGNNNSERMLWSLGGMSASLTHNPRWGSTRLVYKPTMGREGMDKL